MKRHLTPLIVILALTAGQSIAREPQAPPLPSAKEVSMPVGTVRPNSDPGVPGARFIDYVGHFGEVFKLRAEWQIAPSMQGEVEVINFHPKFLPDRDSLERFKPKPSDFAPENFSRLQLIQLVIMPRAADAFQSLAELKEAKIKDLQASGVKFEVVNDPFFGPPTGQWPVGTFEIVVHSPYRLTQLYTATASYLCILTSGLDTPPATAIDSYYSFLRYGLAEWLVPEVSPEEKTAPRDILANGISLHPFTIPYVWMGWVAISGISGLLAWFLGTQKRWDLLRRISHSLLIFSNVGALLGGLVGLSSWPFIWFTRHLPVSAAVSCLFIPITALALCRVRGVRAPKRALIGSTIWALIVAGYFAYCGMFDFDTGSRYVFSVSVLLSFVAYGIAGIIYGALDSSREASAGKGSLLTLLLLLIMSPPAWAQSSSDEEVEAKARALLAKKGNTEADIKDKAIANLRKTTDYYDLQRVEMRGIWSPGEAGSDNDTNARFPLMFDKQISPSHLAETVKTKSMPVWMLHHTINGVKDLRDLRTEAYNQLTSAAIKAVKDLAGKEINEIVAHSWGTEIIYNAILAGKIRPPRRLIVAGMPDRDLEKWKALSKYTGTEVVVYTNTNDPIAGGPRIIGGTIDAAKTGASAAANALVGDGEGLDPARSAKLFDLQWASVCQGKRECNPHQRTPPETEYKSDFKLASHDRFEYYQAMEDGKDLPTPPVEMTLFPPAKNPTPYPGSAPALQAEQDEKLKTEILRIEEAALESVREEARGLVEQAREQVKIAQRDHDARLRIALVDLARRSCADPGSVTQAELSALPDFYDDEFRRNTAFANGLDNCGAMVYLQVSKRMSAEKLRQISTPVVAAPLQRAPPAPQAAPLAPPSPQAAVPSIPFSSVFPGLRDLAASACRSPGSAVVDRHLIHPSHQFSFAQDWEDRSAASLSSGLGDCPRRLFYKLIETIRAGQGEAITELWVRDWAAVYSRSQDTPSFDYSPPTGCIPGDNSRRNCIACGNRRCD